MTKRRLISLGLVIMLIAGAATFGVWRWSRYQQAAILQPEWRAVVAVRAGDGVPGVRDGGATDARFSDPFGVAATPDGTVYVADAGHAQRIRRITPDGSVSTLAGGELGYADGPAASARFRTPSGIALGHDGAIYVADTGNNMIRRIGPDGQVSTVAGGLTAGYRDGREALFNGPVGIAIDRAGRLIVADTYNDRIRAIEPDGTVVTLAGSGVPGVRDGHADQAQFDTPCGVAVNATGQIFVADTGNGAVRMVSPHGIVTTVGPPPPYGLVRPIGIAVSSAGIVYVTDDRGRIVEIVPGISARVLAGSRRGFADGAGEEARFRSLGGLALADPGHLVVADTRNALVRDVAEPSRRPLRPPVSPRVNPRFDVAAFARDPLLWPLDPMEGPFEITGTLGEARGGEGAERFHAGVDVHAPEGSVVRAVRRGVISHPLAAAEFGTLNESVRIGAIAYVHIRVGRSRDGQLLDSERFVATYDESGRMVQLRAKRGARFATGDAIGTANPFNHVHLNIGWPGEEYNPLQFRFVHFEDRVPPTIARGGIRLFTEDGVPIVERKAGRVVVEGRVRIVADAWDQVNGNERRRRLGLYQLGYQVLNRDGSPAPGFEKPHMTVRFDRLAPEEGAAPLVYSSGSGIPFFGRRTTRFLYAITNTLRDGVASAGVWDTTTLPAGDYTLRVIATDFHGNQAVSNRDLPVTIRGASSPPG